MVTKSMVKNRSSLNVSTSNRRCSICGKKMKTPQEMLTIGNIQYCDACYHDSFFANAGSSHRLTLDRCDG
jgi:hypothetical protein